MCVLLRFLDSLQPAVQSQELVFSPINDTNNLEQLAPPNDGRYLTTTTTY